MKERAPERDTALTQQSEHAARSLWQPYSGHRVLRPRSFGPGRNRNSPTAANPHPILVFRILSYYPRARRHAEDNRKGEMNENTTRNQRFINDAAEKVIIS